MKTNKQKLYCYVDETGQDTKGKFFLVTVIVKEQEYIESLQKKLIETEKSTRKNKLKWTKTPFKIRRSYLLHLVAIKEIKSSIFYSTYQDTKEYIPLVSLTVAKSILVKGKANYTSTIIIDGLKGTELDAVRRELKKLEINYRKIRGMKDEQDAILRLADCIAGFLRDYAEKQRYTQEIMKRFADADTIVEL